ncbi:hypothetical protein [Aestuariivirga sp.]|uniref:hypothetical protein n=1 Tax=Aestuariivirga sp. TaxID=2650926 RepID=UPI0025C6631D|nr:hypothetical protein [Aestuariivirga sp.]MCA3554263.1 hypothetical protein [Aestuariivirga sp.]
MTPPSVTGTAAAPALLKLIEAVDEENAALRDQQIFTHAGFTDRKNQALRELMAAQRKEISTAAGPTLGPLLRRLSHALQENSRLLKLHIAAVGEISDIIVSGLRDAESDGTYCRSGARGW